MRKFRTKLSIGLLASTLMLPTLTQAQGFPGFTLTRPEYKITDSKGVRQPGRVTVDGRKSDDPLVLGLRSNATGSMQAGHNTNLLSDDGSLIVGSLIRLRSKPQPGLSDILRQATVWDADGTPKLIDLSVYDDLAGSDAIGISGDGMVIVGNATVINPKAPPPSTGMFKPIGFVQPQTFSRAWVQIGDAPAIDIGNLRDHTRGWAAVRAVSRNGKVVIGTSSDIVPINPSFGTMTTDPSIPAGKTEISRAFRWTESGGMRSLGVLNDDNAGYSNAAAVSDDGKVIVGSSTQFASPIVCPSCMSQLYTERAFSWQNGKMTELALLVPEGPGNYAYSSAADVNSDGSVIVGTADGFAPGSRASSAKPRYTDQAVLWNENGVRGLGFLSDHEQSRSEAYQVNDAGTVVIGSSSTNLVSSQDMYYTDYYSHAFRWTRKDGMKSLGSLARGNRGNSFANDMSADGSIIVGSSETSGSITFLEKNSPGAKPSTIKINRGFIWTEDGGMQAVGTLRDKDDLGSSAVNSISADGSVAIGVSDTNATKLTDQPWRGFSSANQRLFILRLMDTADGVEVGPMLDLVNTQTQLGNSARNQAGAVGGMSGNLSGLVDNELEPGEAGGGGATVSTQGAMPKRMPIALNFSASRTTNGIGLSQNNASLSAAVGLTPYLTFGGFVQTSSQGQGTATFDFAGNSPSAGLYLRGGQKFGTGLTWKLSYAMMKGDATITRDAGFANTEIGTGTASVEATALNAEVGFGYNLRNTAMNSFVQVKRTTGERGAFTETAGATFPINYDAFSQEHTTFVLGTSARIATSSRTALTLGVKIERDLNTSNNAITGTSAIPGFTNFAVAGPAVVNENRASISANYEIGLSNGGSVVLGAYAGQSRYSNDMSSGISIGYTARW